MVCNAGTAAGAGACCRQTMVNNESSDTCVWEIAHSEEIKLMQCNGVMIGCFGVHCLYGMRAFDRLIGSMLCGWFAAAAIVIADINQ